MSNKPLCAGSRRRVPMRLDRRPYADCPECGRFVQCTHARREQDAWSGELRDHVRQPAPTVYSRGQS